jgi:hypothetical protein
MNDDMERRLRELFEDKATESAAASRAPEPVVTRARRRQLGTIAVSVVTVIALAGVSFAGIRTLNGTGERGLMPADISPYDSGRYPVFERTAQIESLSVTSPSDWYLVNQWPLGSQIATQTSYSCSDSAQAIPAGSSGSDGSSGSYGASGSYGPSGSYGNSICASSPSPEVDIRTLPVLQLSNRDLGLSMPACGLGGTPPVTMTGDDAVMAVVIDYEALSGRSFSDTVSRDEALAIDGSGEPDDDICGKGYYRKFVAGGIPYVAWASFGPDITDEDRTVALNALTLANEGFIGASGDPSASPAYVLAGVDGGRLELRPSNRDGGNVDLALVSVRGRNGSFGTGDFTVPDVPVEDCCGTASNLPGGGVALAAGGATPFRFGAVTKEATGVELQPSDGSDPVPGTMVPLPPSLMNFPFDLFFLDAGALNGKIVATGLATPTATVAPSDPTAVPTPSTSPDPGIPSLTPQPGVPTIEGDDLGFHWRAAAAEDNAKACVYLTVDDVPGETRACGDPSSPQVSLLQLPTGAGVFLVGLVPKTMDLEWEVTQAGGSVGAGTHVESNWSGSSLIPFLIAIPETDGHITLQFLGPDGGRAFPDWETTLIDVTPTASP